MKTARTKLSAAGFCLLSVSVLIWASIAQGSGPQPVSFNHQIHLTDVGMDCTDCHQSVAQGRKATLPPKSICIECHEEPQGESAEEQKLVSILQSDDDLEWSRIYVLPKHVYFSHFRHVTLGQIACLTCHGDMKELTAPPTRTAVDILDMDFCMDCHEDRNAGNDCLACHN